MVIVNPICLLIAKETLDIKNFCSKIRISRTVPGADQPMPTFTASFSDTDHIPRVLSFFQNFLLLITHHSLLITVSAVTEYLCSKTPCLRSTLARLLHSGRVFSDLPPPHPLRRRLLRETAAASSSIASVSLNGGGDPLDRSFSPQVAVSMATWLQVFANALFISIMPRGEV
jgi:hypothetical protein